MDIDVTKILEALINALLGGGVSLSILNWIRHRKAKKAGISANEHVAVVQTTPQEKVRDPLIAYLRAELRRQEAIRMEKDRRIDRLEAHIWMSKPPPPPE